MLQEAQSGILTQSGKLRIVVEPAGPSLEAIEAAKQQLLNSAAVRSLLEGKKYRLLHFKVVERGSTDKQLPGQLDHFEATLYNYSDQYAIIARGRLDAAHEAQIIKSAAQPLPSDEELQEALHIAACHPDIQQRAGRDSLFPSMPSVIAQPLPDGRTERIIPLMIHPNSRQGVYELIGVKLGSEQVIQALDWREARPEIFDRLVHPARPFPLAPAPQVDYQHFWFSVYDVLTGKLLWKMLVTRPSASSGTNGSGLELRYVDFQGKRILYQAHLPILDVLYDGNIQEYRDWQTSEAGFDAVGTPFQDANGNSLPAFLHCSAQPQTPFETGSDGPFSGVAFYENPDDSWTLSTMMQAGWYRYYMAYTFSLDGTIRPRVGFTTNGSNPYAGVKHVHHAYFRFDFDIGTYWNDVVEMQELIFYIDPITHQFHFQIVDVPITFEKKLYRQFFTPAYIVREKGTNQGYRIVKGTNDGTAQNDAYGEGDVWVLRYRSNEIDDHVQSLTKPSGAQLDNFVNQESVDGADVVFWYAVHFTHDPLMTHGEKDFGPDLYPLH